MLTSLAILLAAAGPLDVEGVWLTEGGQSQVEIASEGDSVSGEIIWYMNHEEELAFDTENPDEAARNREILGLQILGGFERAEEKWRRGEIYDPTEGKTYRSAIYRIDEDTLGVQGCVGFICLTQEWERVPDAEIRRIEREPVIRDQAGR